MGRNLYTIDEDDFLKKNLQEKTNIELANILGRTEASIGKRLYKLKLTRESIFSIEDDEYLKQNRLEKTHAELAEALGKNKDAISTRIKKLKLQKNKPRYVNKNGQKREGYDFILYSDWATMLDTPCPVMSPCQNCKELNPIVHYYQYKKNEKSGFVDLLGKNRHSICPNCQRIKYLAKDEREKMLQGAKTRSKKDGRDFSLTINDIIIPKRCPILGIELKAEVGSGRPGGTSNYHAPQLDRIDSSKGYISGNVCVISTLANTQKKNGTAREFLAITAFLIDLRTKDICEIEMGIPYANRSTGELINIIKKYLHNQNP